MPNILIVPKCSLVDEVGAVGLSGWWLRPFKTLPPLGVRLDKGRGGP